MTRRKIKIAYITNAAARNATYKKRKKGLLKKLSELTTLCGVQGCAVLYPPPGCNSQQPEAWPSSAEAHRLLSEYKNLPVSRMVNQESFLEQWLARAKERVEKLNEGNRKKDTQLMCQNLGGKELKDVKNEDLDELGELIEQNLKDINDRVHALVNAHALWGKKEH